jgi:potassium-transporting ATPase KdpC subunit
MSYLRQLGAGLRALLVLTLLLGVAYPLAVWAVAQVALNGKANGSQVKVDGDVVGSSLIGQTFDGEEWFHSRPSAAGDGYDPLSTGASNLAATSDDLLALVEERRAAIADEEGVDPAEVPPDAVTASGSGLDPHISPEYARLQVQRVASARELSPESVRKLVDSSIQGRDLGFAGQPRVNVLLLNVGVAELSG